MARSAISPLKKPSRPKPIASLPSLGWREWVRLPELGVTPIKAKIDTGARSSALHAIDIHLIQQQDQKRVHFQVHPLQRDTRLTIPTSAPLLDQRLVRSSNGKAEMRPVILTQVCLGERCWPIELTLTNRSMMGFRLLLGRQALSGRYLVDSSQSFLQSSPHADRDPLPE